MRRVLVLGTGFGAFSLATRLDPRRHEVVVVSPRNHFLFTPLLPSTAVGTVEFRTILSPVRRGRPELSFRLGAAEGLDLAGRRVRCRTVDGSSRWEEPFDALVVAVGARGNTFGVPGVAEHALFLKELADARRIREGLVANLEAAMVPGVAAAERDRLLHFVAVGGGPTGVRFAAELHDLLVRDLPRSYPDLAGRARITIIEAGKELLPAYDESLRRYTARLFRRRRIEVRAGARVEEVGPGVLRLAGGETILAGMVLWATGFAAVPFVESLPFERDRHGRILVEATLEVPGHPGIFAIGDCARPRNAELPQLAQIAEQQGRHLARTLERPEPFRWADRGMSTFLGGGEAVADTPGGSRAGSRAYWMWRTSVFSQLVSPRNKILVPLDRLRARIFGRDLSKF